MLGLGLCVILAACDPDIDVDKLRQRIDQSQPTWQSYQEDIKGQVGATPVAQWKGRPVETRHEGATVSVLFAIESPWADYGVAVPILLRDPMGGVYRNASATHAAGVTTYVFELREDSGRSSLPWLEIKYPHHEQRLALNPEGQWSADSGP